MYLQGGILDFFCNFVLKMGITPIILIANS